MDRTENGSIPQWIFVILAIGGLLACGIFIGVMSLEGFTTKRLLQAVGFGVLGLIMFWGAIHYQ